MPPSPASRQWGRGAAEKPLWIPGCSGFPLPSPGRSQQAWKEENLGRNSQEVCPPQGLKEELLWNTTPTPRRARQTEVTNETGLTGAQEGWKPGKASWRRWRHQPCWVARAVQVEKGEQPQGRETAYAKVSQVSGETRSQLGLSWGSFMSRVRPKVLVLLAVRPWAGEVRRRQGRGAALSRFEVMTRDISECCSWSVRSIPAAFSRAQTTVLPSLPASSSPATPVFSLLLQPQARGPASRVPSPLCLGALRNSRVPPKRTGMEVPVLTAAVAVHACVWEEQGEPQQLEASLSPSCLVYACRHLKGQTKQLKKHSDWATGLPHSPPPPTPLSTFPSHPEGSIMARQGQVACGPSPELQLNGRQSWVGLERPDGRELGRRSPSVFHLP